MQKLIKKLLEGENLIMGHTVIGYPSLAETIEIVKTLAKSGCGIVEIQMPFSDPVADGPVIMKANKIAIGNGITTKICIETMKKLTTCTDIPLLFMGYFNTVFNYGVEKFCKDAAKAGCQGLIIPDMPIDEEHYENFYQSCIKYNLAPILVVAPNTTDERLKKINKFAKAFVYVMARKGSTGDKTNFDQEFEKYIKRVKKNINLPLAVGFGIREKSQVDFVHKHAQIAIIGSEIVNVYEREKMKGLEKFISSLKS